jgi:hypothetical protein
MKMISHPETKNHLRSPYPLPRIIHRIPSASSAAVTHPTTE